MIGERDQQDVHLEEERGRRWGQVPGRCADGDIVSEFSPGLLAVLEHVKTARGFDFTGYKAATIERRVTKRVEATGSESYTDYLDHLQVHPDEFDELFDTVLINVTGFFRDADAWDVLRDDVLPELGGVPSSSEPIRIWCAGCASGEEAYTIAMLLCGALGEEAFRERVKIYGTDVDESALDEARQATYSSQQLEAVPAPLRARYFTAGDGSFTFRKDLRRALIFGRNDLVQDAPISKVDLLTCRNTLIYFNAETQQRILRRFHFALRSEGRLFLGKSEMLLTQADLFEPVDLRSRIFTPASIPEVQTRGELADATTRAGGPLDTSQSLVAALDASPIAQLVVDRTGRLSFANEAARTMLEVAYADFGRPLQDLRASYRPAELRAGLDRVFEDGHAVEMDMVTAEFQGEQRTVEIRLTPIGSGDEVEAAVVHFVDVSPQRQLEKDVERLKSELSAAYEELQSSIEELETTNEELETTNEELQSTNEELETTNEELQSSNEELETMNEELQSSNEELETTNEELRSRSLQLRDANAFMDTVLTSIGVGVIVIDGDHRVRVWNAQSEDFWGVRREEVTGTHVFELDVGLPLESLRGPLRDVLSSAGTPTAFNVEAVDRRGRPFMCGVDVVPLPGDGDEPGGAIILTRRAEPGMPPLTVTAVGPV